MYHVYHVGVVISAEDIVSFQTLNQLSELSNLYTMSTLYKDQIKGVVITRSSVEH